MKEKEKDHLAADIQFRNEARQREMDRIFQHKQSLKKDMSQLRKDKRIYLVQMNERDEKRRREGETLDVVGVDYLTVALNDINDEMSKIKTEIDRLIMEESTIANTPQRSNVTPTRRY